MLSVLPLLCSAALTVAGTAHGLIALRLGSPARHVRTTDSTMQRLIAAGVHKSATFASLVARLEASDVIVYIQPAHELGSTLSGRLLLLEMSPHQRYLRVQIRWDGSSSETIALIGHELRHAIEVADATEVRSEAALAALYERIGVDNRGGEHRYDTLAAQMAGRQVRKELAG